MVSERTIIGTNYYMKVAAIIPAAGKGRRLKSNIDKPYIKINNKPLIAYTLSKFSKNIH